jgi:predicted RNase H-like HicB family nuclease
VSEGLGLRELRPHPRIAIEAESTGVDFMNVISDPDQGRTGKNMVHGHRSTNKRTGRVRNSGRVWQCCAVLPGFAPESPRARAEAARRFDWRGEVEHIESMKGEFTAIIESAPEGGYWAICPEVAGANGQGETVEEAKASLRDAILLVLQDRVEDIRRGLPADAIESVIAIG